MSKHKSPNLYLYMVKSSTELNYKTVTYQFGNDLFICWTTIPMALESLEFYLCFLFLYMYTVQVSGQTPLNIQSSHKH